MESNAKQDDTSTDALRSALAGLVAVLQIDEPWAREHVSKFNDAMIKARAALSGSRPPSTEGLREWQPIETAPKDGRSILIAGGTYRYSGETFPEDRPYEHVAKAAYVDGEWFGGFGSEYDESYSHSPTHWMPLPPSPEIPENDQ